MSKKLENAKAILEAESKRVAEICSKEIEQVLKKHGCTMVAQGRFQGNQIETGISIVKA